MSVIKNCQLVSVVVPIYNHQRFVVEAIQSVYDQTYRPIELILIDDGSTDSSATVVQDFLASSPIPDGISVSFKSRPNKGASNTINEGIDQAKGEYIAILNSDDAYMPSRLERFISVAKRTGSRLIFSYVSPIGESGQPLDYDHRWRQWYNDIIMQELDVAPSISVLLLTYNIGVSTGNFVLHRSLITEVGYFQNYRYAHDIDFLFKVVPIEEPYLIREKLYKYRLHRSNTISVDDYKVNAEYATIIRNYLVATTQRRVKNPLAPTFVNWPSSLAAALRPQARALSLAFDKLLEVPKERPGIALLSKPRSTFISPPSGGVTIFTHEMSQTGAPVLALELARAIQREGKSANIITMHDGPLRSEFVKSGIPVKVVRFSRTTVKVARLGDLVRISRRISKFPNLQRFLAACGDFISKGANAYCSIKLAKHVKEILLFNSFATYPLAFRVLSNTRRSAFWYIHETYDPHAVLRGRSSRIEFDRLVKFNRVSFLFGSEATRRAWADEGYDGEVIYWSGLPYSVEAGDQQAGISMRRVVLSVGTSGTRKGTRTLIEAFAYGRRKGIIPEDVDLLIVGMLPPSVNPQSRDLVIRSHQKDLIGHVRLVGLVDTPMLASYYREAAVYVQSSTMECLPLALLTAMQHHLPIVTTDVDGCKEAIIDHVCGLTVPPRQIPMMAKAIAELLSKPDMAKAYGEAASARFRDLFSLEATVEPLFDELLGRP